VGVSGVIFLVDFFVFSLWNFFCLDPTPFNCSFCCECVCVFRVSGLQCRLASSLMYHKQCLGLVCSWILAMDVFDLLSS